MPHERMNCRQVAGYLHMDYREVTKLASRGQIPCRKVRGEFLFQKDDLDHWVEAQMHELGPERLKKIEKGVSAHHGFDHEELVCPLVPETGIAVPLAARTGDKAIRALVSLAETAGLIYAPSQYQTLDEAVEIAKVAREYDGIYDVHLRSEGDDLIEAMEEVIEIGRRSGIPILITHFKAFGRKN